MKVSVLSSYHRKEMIYWRPWSFYACATLEFCGETNIWKDGYFPHWTYFHAFYPIFVRSKLFLKQECFPVWCIPPAAVFSPPATKAALPAAMHRLPCMPPPCMPPCHAHPHHTHTLPCMPPATQNPPTSLWTDRQLWSFFCINYNRLNKRIALGGKGIYLHVYLTKLNRLLLLVFTTKKSILQ